MESILFALKKYIKDNNLKELYLIKQDFGLISIITIIKIIIARYSII